MGMILLTNDDGYDASGFQALYQGLKKEFDVFVVAPRTQQSGASHSLTLRRPIRVEKLRDQFFTIDGTPTDCVLLAYHDLIRKKIDMIISGINHGPNMGSDVFYSGTVAAALQGATLGISSMAVSLSGHEYINFTPAANYAKRLIHKVIELGISKVILNVNIPESKIIGTKITKLGKRIYRDKVIRNNQKENVMYSVIDGTLSYKVATDTDFKAVEEGCVSITPLKLDLTDYESMGQLKAHLVE
ncbi:5'/3'-nucleotidase SurE [candidate division WOR-3 bacterium RBG_13_43_14]|uniref:5'-nucleotidase SurE n=1 Tax=candidate division WOR-3 bacterium RBG_13_43_14 TaxID=1802590 RepID=A0A1F4U9S5_UNCW3|nr:MAG: 5'/3'-nucleotidase SurE [candidate division WOR-3 bacterium RBG_13_43_14]